VAKWNVTVSTKGALPNIKQHLSEIVSIVAQTAKEEWVREAKRSLHSTRNMYVEGLGDPEINNNVAVIRLSGWLPNALEDGLSPFDMKRGLLQGPKAKRSKTGNPYTVVPLPICIFLVTVSLVERNIKAL
jgi:hypothetical protein